MKKIFFAGIALLLTASIYSQPPESNSQQSQRRLTPPSAEERWQRESKRISETLNLSQDELAKLKPIYLEFFKNMDSERGKMAPPPPPPPLPKQEMEKILNIRNDQLKQVLTQGQMEKLIEAEKQFQKRRKGGAAPPLPSRTPPTTR